jgi:hypothetical protein
MGKKCRGQLLILYIAIHVDVTRMDYMQDSMRLTRGNDRDLLHTVADGSVKRSVRYTVTFLTPSHFSSLFSSLLITSLPYSLYTPEWI